MELYVALLRGINVSGHRMIKMNDLKVSLSSLGFQNIQSYLQSGNLIFATLEKDKKKMEDMIKNQVLNDFGYDVPIIVFAKEFFLKVFKNNPILLKSKDLDFKKLAVSFLDQSPEKEKINNFNIEGYPEEIIIDGRVIYLYYPNGMGGSKLNNNLIENKLDVIATIRNWNTVSKISQILLN